MTHDAGGDDRPAVTRREAVAGAGGLLTGAGAFRAIDNVLLGYGQTGNGTNVVEQDLADLLMSSLSLAYDERIAGHPVRLAGGAIEVSTESDTRRLDLAADEGASVRALDDDLGLDGRLAALYADLRAVRSGDVRFAFSQPAAFFDRVRAADARPDVLAALRGRGDRTVPPATVERFAGTPPSEPEPLADALVGAFREQAAYDVPRYLAGAIEDNVIFGAADLRRHLGSDVTFGAMLSSDDDRRLFCWEFALRSMEALQAAAPWHQRLPVAAAYVRDARHKHVYTGLASAIRTDGDLVVPMTFLDYTHSTLYDDVNVTWLTGRGLAAYDDRHRVTHVYW